MRTTVTPQRLREFFQPRSFALVGASDKSTFSALLHRNLVAAGHESVTYLVNRRAERVHGRRAHPSCRAIGRPVDLAFVMVPAAAVGDALRDAAAAGVRGVLVLSSGFAEAGEEGRRRQEELVDLAAELDLLLLGPNVLGFTNVAAGVPAMVLADQPQVPGNVALISQSGASCGAMKDFAALAGVGLSHVITVGNEAMVTVGHLIDYLVDDEQTRAIAVFMEGIRQPEVFAAATRRAAEAGKAVVVLKAGRSELAARAAASHTGALVGDDRVIDAVFARHGVIRVDTIESMLVTAGVAAHTGPLVRPGVGVVSISGGACDILADLAQDTGTALPELSAATAEHIRAVMPSYGHVQNPLDITGAAILDPSLWEEAVAAVGQDPGIGAVLAVNSLPWREDGAPFYGQKYVDAIGAGAARSAAPVIYLTQVTQPIGARARDVLDRGGLTHVVPGLQLGIDALARVARWSGDRQRLAEEGGAGRVRPRDVDPVPLSEADARALLEDARIPVVPARHVRSAEEAERAAREFGVPVAMKIVSADIAHKSDVGGVRLGVDARAAAEAYAQIVEACGANAADARLDGVLVSPMRAHGLELLVGVTRDPDWGLMLAVGLGGVLVEVLDDVALTPLPVSPERARSMLEGLRGAALLRGVRGRPGADVAALAEVVAAVGRLAEELGPHLESLEINPLRAAGSCVEALDVLVTWRDSTPHTSGEEATGC
ncbi:acetate--CoA ligase family protein [Thermobifida halotolerans]|uniref:Acetate--CoA ligase family protein n=1 Tax=Thermobifida halotolerans TaxID=483545 RepID=A0AA97LZ06_9ACTN|nr:acetate--CoA ligase family protein [Thermobifida halotolerans]UOE20689.1 acetate--CoA ligase family protein [Thermobifida halotolerans]